MSRGEEVGGPGVIVRTCRFRTAVGGRSKLASEAAAAAGWGIGMAAVTCRRPSTPVHVRYVGGIVDRTQDGVGDSHDEAYTRSMAPPTVTEAVVLRAFAFGEADRVLHVYTQASGRDTIREAPTVSEEEAPLARAHTPDKPLITGKHRAAIRQVRHQVLQAAFA